MPDPISYTLRLPAPQTHYAEVLAHIPTGGRSAVELMMEVRTPGSYVVREFARNVEALTATAGAADDVADTDGPAGGQPDRPDPVVYGRAPYQFRGVRRVAGGLPGREIRNPGGVTAGPTGRQTR